MVNNVVLFERGSYAEVLLAVDSMQVNEDGCKDLHII
jgi:hypothetical protein